MSLAVVSGIICLVCGIMFSVGFYQEHKKDKKHRSHH